MHNISDEITSYHTVKTAMEMQGDSLKDVNSAIFVRETQRIFRSLFGDFTPEFFLTKRE